MLHISLPRVFTRCYVETNSGTVVETRNNFKRPITKPSVVSLMQQCCPDVQQPNMKQHGENTYIFIIVYLWLIMVLVSIILCVTCLFSFPPLHLFFTLVLHDFLTTWTHHLLQLDSLYDSCLMILSSWLTMFIYIGLWVKYCVFVCVWWGKMDLPWAVTVFRKGVVTKQEGGA